MAKDLSAEEIQQVQAELADKKSPIRRRAAKKIGKHNLTSLGDELLSAYLKEREDERTWETQCAMIWALGKLKHKAALPYLAEITDRNKAMDSITSAAALSYVRIARKDTNDIAPILQLTAKGAHSVFCGAIEALPFDKVIPPPEEQRRLIELFDNTPVETYYVRGCGDARMHLMSAMARWDKVITEEYITRFLNSENVNHRLCAEAALKGKCWCLE